MGGGLWSRDMIGWVLVAACLPPAAVVVVEQGAEGVVRMGAVLAVSAAWEALFRALRGIALSPTPVLLAVLLAALAPVGLSPVQLALGASFGLVLGELVFGGWGRNVVGAAPVALALLYLSHPAGIGPGSELTMILASGASGLLLLATGVLSLAIVAGAGLGLWAVMLLLGAPLDSSLSGGAVALGLVLLLADPVTAPTTGPARSVYGLLGGALIALLAGAAGLSGAERATIFAVLLAQVFSPALDYAGLALWRMARDRRHV